MAKRTYGNNYDELVGVRIPIKHRNILEARASERNSSLSEVLREIIAVAVEAMEETQRSQPKPKPVVKHVIRAKRPEDMNKPEYNEHMGAKVDNLLRSKGLGGRKKEKPGLKNYPGYSSKK